jgi:hypothetical protein
MSAVPPAPYGAGQGTNPVMPAGVAMLGQQAADLAAKVAADAKELADTLNAAAGQVQAIADDAQRAIQLAQDVLGATGP